MHCLSQHDVFSLQGKCEERNLDSKADSNFLTTGGRRFIVMGLSQDSKYLLPDYHLCREGRGFGIYLHP